MPVTVEEVSNGDITKWSTSVPEAFVCADGSTEDCFVSFELDDLYLMTGIETSLDMSSECFPKILKLEYSVTILNHKS
jgi:hypothetical protein